MSTRSLSVHLPLDDLQEFIADADEFTYGSAVWLLRDNTKIVVTPVYENGQVVGQRTVLA